MRVITNISQTDDLSSHFSQNDLCFTSGYTSGSQFDIGSGSDISGSQNQENCFFNCMEYLGSWCEVDGTSEDYQKLFHDGDFWSFGSDSNNDNVGPTDYFPGDKGEMEPNKNSFNFINMFFETKDSCWQESTSIIDNLVNKRKGDDAGKVLAVIKLNLEESHAVILEADAGGYYEVYDPTSSERYLVNKENVLYAAKITGKKTEDEK